jgi:hypothetical protein
MKVKVDCTMVVTEMEAGVFIPFIETFGNNGLHPSESVALKALKRRNLAMPADRIITTQIEVDL